MHNHSIPWCTSSILGDRHCRAGLGEGLCASKFLDRRQPAQAPQHGRECGVDGICCHLGHGGDLQWFGLYWRACKKTNTLKTQQVMCDNTSHTCEGSHLRQTERRQSAQGLAFCSFALASFATSRSAGGVGCIGCTKHRGGGGGRWCGLSSLIFTLRLASTLLHSPRCRRRGTGCHRSRCWCCECLRCLG